MCRRLHLAVLALVLLLRATDAGSAKKRGKGNGVPRTELQHRCKRPVSRRVRAKLEKEVYQRAREEGITEWPQSCPLDPAKDLWRSHEEHKRSRRYPGSEWKCGFCNKTFKDEHYLDLHMERRHMNETPVGGVCLADYCEFFDVCYHREDGVPNPKLVKPRSADDDEDDFPMHHRKYRKEKFLLTCNTTKMEASRRLCYLILSQCLPHSDAKFKHLHGELSRNLCSTLDCELRAEHLFDNTEAFPLWVDLLIVVAFCAVVFASIVMLVANSDNVAAFLTSQNLASGSTIKTFNRTTELTRQTLGMDPLKCV